MFIETIIPALLLTTPAPSRSALIGPESGFQSAFGAYEALRLTCAGKAMTEKTEIQRQSVQIDLPVSRFDSVLSEIAGYRSLTAGWDLSHAVPISESSIKDALAFVRNLSSQIATPSSMPEIDGSTSIYWSAASGETYLEINFTGHGRISLFARSGVLGKTYIDDAALFDPHVLDSVVAYFGENDGGRLLRAA